MEKLEWAGGYVLAMPPLALLLNVVVFPGDTTDAHSSEALQ